jgi:hypothetical protein
LKIMFAAASLSSFAPGRKGQAQEQEDHDIIASQPPAVGKCRSAS